MDEARLQKLAEHLDQQNDWPAEYLFKFIVPMQEVDAVVALFPGVAVSQRQSRTGKYVSTSARVIAESSEGVVAVYRQAAGIPGLIAL
ncbi:MAG: DUF493 family protein [Gammaproteobacteria bacterium]